MQATLIALLFLFRATQTPPPAVEFWDNVFSAPAPVFSTAPNAFLVHVVKDLKPGRALDVGMGQGRNSVFLAKLGWDVCGFDISERGMEQARKSAAAAGTKITTIKATLEDFDYGVSQWDLIVGTYVGVAWLKPAARALKPGGFLVVEGYAAHPQAPAGAAWAPNELLKLFMDQNLQVVRYEDVKADPDWRKTGGVVRMFARKPN